LHIYIAVNNIESFISIVYIYFMEVTNDTKSMPTIIIRDIDEELRKRLRIICLEKGISMNQQLKELIEEFVAEEETKKK